VTKRGGCRDTYIGFERGRGGLSGNRKRKKKKRAEVIAWGRGEDPLENVGKSLSHAPKGHLPTGESLRKRGFFLSYAEEKEETILLLDIGKKEVSRLQPFGKKEGGHFPLEDEKEGGGGFCFCACGEGGGGNQFFLSQRRKKGIRHRPCSMGGEGGGGKKIALFLVQRGDRLGSAHARKKGKAAGPRKGVRSKGKRGGGFFFAGGGKMAPWFSIVVPKRRGGGERGKSNPICSGGSPIGGIFRKRPRPRKRGRGDLTPFAKKGKPPLPP